MGHRRRADPRCSCAVAALLLALGGWHPAAAADADERRRELEARTLYGTGEYGPSLQLYIRLYDETRHPTYLRNMGRCYQRLGKTEQAIAAFREYLSLAKNLDAVARAEIEDTIRSLEAKSPGVASDSLLPPAFLAAEGANARPPTDRRRLGAFLRADLAVAPGRGLAWVPGLSLGLGHNAEVNAAAFIGAHSGALAGARLFGGDGQWRPGLSLSLLVLFPPSAQRPGERETLAGMQGGAGVRWQASRHLGAFADISVTWFPGAAADLRPLWLVPSLGVQAWL